MTKNMVLFTLFILLACAKQGLPPGGPEDRTPPEVVRSIPVSGDTLVDPHTSVQVWFNENIQAGSASDAIFITPYMGEEIKYQFRGRRIKITFPKSLESNRTYVITFGTGIKDHRNNAMEVSSTLAFSTGPVIDEGEITGQVYGVKDARGIDVWAYNIKDSLNIDPSVREPEYIVQCEEGGKFRFSYVSPGLYRLFTVRDRLADRLYQVGEDEVGMTFRDAFISREEQLKDDGLYFKMAKEDTLGPSLIRAVSLDRHHLTLRFDEPISPEECFSRHNLVIVSVEDSLDTLSFRQVYPDPLNGQLLHVLTHAQEDGKQYILSVKNFWDEAGNPVDSAYKATLFNGVGRPDTTSPTLIFTEPQPGATMVGLKGIVRLVFSEVMDSIGFREGFSLMDTLGNTVEGEFRFTKPSEVTFVSKEHLKSRWTYDVGLMGEGVEDLAGNPIADTLFRFQTLDEDTLSEISGRVIDPDSAATGEIHIIARQVENSELTYTQILPGPGMYRLTDILPGQYVLECFLDQDGNGRYSLGRPFPYKPSERFIVYPDTVRVRSRWPNEGNDVILPEYK